MNDQPAIYVTRPFWHEVAIQALAGLVAGSLVYLLFRRS